MPTLTHSQNNDLLFTGDTSPAKGVTSWDVIDAGANAYYDYVNVTFDLAFEAGFDGPARIHARISGDGAGTKPEDYVTEILEVTHNSGSSRAVGITLRQFNYIGIGIENDTDTEKELTITDVRWEGVKITGD